MRRRSRTRRVLKWVGTTGCALIVVTFLAGLAYVPCFARSTWCAAIDDGCLQVRWNAPPGTLLTDGLIIFENENPGNMKWWVNISLGTPSTVVLPTWLILAALGVPTAFLWWRDRAPLPGRCAACNYDLKGLPEPRCPECGTPFEREEDAT